MNSSKLKHLEHSIRVQCVIFGVDLASQPPSLQVLVNGTWDYDGAAHSKTPVATSALLLPRGLVANGDGLESAASQVVRERAGIRSAQLEQLYAFDPDKDGLVNIAYYALVDRNGKKASDGSEWLKVEDLDGHKGQPRLIFQDMKVIAKALVSLRRKVRIEPLGFSVLPERFTMPQLRALYETVLGASLDERNFAKKMLGMGILRRVSVTKRGKGEQGRPATIYEFDDGRYEALRKKGWSFEV